MTQKTYICPNCGSKHVQAGARQPAPNVKGMILHTQCLDCGYGGQRIVQIRKNG